MRSESQLLLLLLVNVVHICSAMNTTTRVKKNSTSKVSPHIIGGSAVPCGLGQYPWTVSVQRSQPSPAVYCGGSLIHVKWVLTSAYCARGGTAFLIRAGTLDVLSGPSTTAARVFVHPGYSSTNSHHNIALINLAQQAVLSDTINTVRLLPRSMCWDSSVYMNVLTGWGLRSLTDTTLSPTLMRIGLSELPNLSCLNAAGASFVISSVLCTPANPWAMPYIGDEGNPLVRVPTSTSPYLQVGITSLYKPNLPSLFTRVCHYHDWMQAITGINFG